MENFELVQELKLELIRDYERYVAIVAGLTGSSEDDVSEAFHTVVCRMLVGLRRRPAGNPVIAWRPYIIQSVVNELRQKSRNVARRRNTIVLFSELDPDGRRQVSRLQARELRPDKAAERNELAAIAWGELEKLPPRRQRVIAEHSRGYTFKEIAHRLSIDPATARAHYHIGIAQLRHRLRKVA